MIFTLYSHLLSPYLQSNRMRRETILSIDQGTTNTKAILVNATGEVVCRAARPLAIHYPQPAWVEQDAMAIWQTVQESIDECLQGQPAPAAVAITNQRETVILWERATGKPVAPAVIWQCQRGTTFCKGLDLERFNPMVRQHTGLAIDPMFSASKMRWLLDHVENGRQRAEAGELCFGTVDSWLLFQLTHGRIHACDVTNASRTLLFDLHTLDWNDEILDLFGIPRPALPLVKPSQAIYGETARCGALPAGIPIGALIGDSHGSLYGHAGFQPGSIKVTYGTGSSLMTPMPAPKLSQQGISTTVAWGKPSQTTYAFEGNIYATGAAVQWTGDLFGWQDTPQQIESLAASVPDSGGVYFVPALVGLGAPHWDDAARGLITGLTRGSGAAHLARATLEAVAYQIRDVFDLMRAEAGVELQTLLVDGGGSRNQLLMQFQADILGCPVQRNLSVDVAAVGAAYLAGLATGLWQSEAEVAALPRVHDRFEPKMAESQRLALYAGWQAAMARTLFKP
ncbi:MAG: glycerol kinase GlpK [Caldilineaceae bacterium]